MKIGKRNILYIFIAVVVVALCYVIIATAFSSTLRFKSFYESSITTTSLQDNTIYTLDKEDNIVFLRNDNGKITISKITSNNVEPTTLFTLNLDSSKCENISFFRSGEYYYLKYNHNSSVIRFDMEMLYYINFKEIPEGDLLINPYDNSFYLYNDSKIYKLVEFENTFESSYVVYEINETITNIKSGLSFIGEYDLIIPTYNGDLYYADMTSSFYLKMNYKFVDFTIANDTLYYAYNSEDKLGVSSFKNNEESSFEVNRKDYQSIMVVDDYLYLISENEMNKVSLSRKKNHETLQMTSYSNMTYNLANILIVSEKLMYLPMIKKASNYDASDSYTYTYYLYRYKK